MVLDIKVDLQSVSSCMKGVLVLLRVQKKDTDLEGTSNNKASEKRMKNLKDAGIVAGWDTSRQIVIFSCNTYLSWFTKINITWMVEDLIIFGLIKGIYVVK